ncbi:uncharacterized protein LOC135839312 isoform X1 [Planococcus citri]|uniref:uncharacterized protein LOC135839312 isoform X1 n=1 Tax=Planococcus citri TaxID=170843 RepID=UPI0031F8E051
MIYLLLPLFFTVIESLRDVVVDIPAAVTPGETVVMTCTYDLEGDDLYSVKWYKGRQEFYRYVPKELPHIKVFPMLGINVDISQSGPTKVTLREVHWELSGKYRCEVSTDAPYFHTQVVGSHMHVVKAPSGKPSLRLEKTHYGLGETVRGNCSSPISSPASNITWLVNNKKMKPSFENVTVIETNESVDPVKYVKIAGIEFQVTSFHVGKLKIVCTADVYRVFTVSSEIVLEEERPKLASIMGTSYDTATGISNTTPYTLYLWVLMALHGLILSVFR